MTNDTYFDGNALGGILLEVFGGEMTDANGCCDHCGTVSQLGAMLVYHGPGAVMRCPSCSTVVMVTRTDRERTRAYFNAVRWLEPGRADNADDS